MRIGAANFSEPPDLDPAVEEGLRRFLAARPQIRAGYVLRFAECGQRPGEIGLAVEFNEDVSMLAMPGPTQQIYEAAEQVIGPFAGVFVVNFEPMKDLITVSRCFYVRGDATPGSHRCL